MIQRKAYGALMRLAEQFPVTTLFMLMSADGKISTGEKR